MIISEQKHSNFNRIYYHGKIKNRKLLSNEFYLTTKFAYAFMYSTGYIYGEVEEYRLNQIANIFNAKCKSDESALRKFCQKNAPNILKYIDLLKDNDWKSIRDNQLRDDLIYIIRDLKYDGYFNFEIDQKMLDELHDRNIYKYDNQKHSPAIGIFNTDILILKNTWDKNNFELCSAFTEFKNEETKRLKEIALFEKSKNTSSKEIINFIRKQTISLTYEEIIKLTVNINLKEALAYKRALEKTIDLFLERIE